LAEVNRAENPTEKPLSPETQKALERWYAKQWDFYGLYPQANQNKLSDFLAHPVKSIGVFLGIGMMALTGLVFGATLKAAQVRKGVEAKEFKNKAIYHGLELLFLGGLTFADYYHQKIRNKDTLKGIQTLGEQATRREWLDYKKTHPAIANA
jgi:hypothetical protein